MPTRAHLPFDTIYEALKAAAEATRLRILALLAEAELTVSDLTEILRQSQPRISRHLRLLAEARLVERYRECAWAFFRLAQVRATRAAAAQAYFKEHAAEWDRIRRLHAADAAVEAEISAVLADRPF